jgi:hypothetical protein
MRNVAITKTIKLDLTNADWQLYGDAPADVSANINKAVSDILNSPATTARESRKLCEAILCQHSKHGAEDSEPMWVLADILREFYK